MNKTLTAVPYSELQYCKTCQRYVLVVNEKKASKKVD